jgi:hypothetical protein
MSKESIYDAKADDLGQALCRITHVGEQTAIVRSVVLVANLTAARDAAPARFANDRIAPAEPQLCTPDELHGVLGVMRGFDEEARGTAPDSASDSAVDAASLAVLFQQAPHGNASIEIEVSAARAAAFLDAVHDALDEDNTAARGEVARMRLQIPAGGPR